MAINLKSLNSYQGHADPAPHSFSTPPDSGIICGICKSLYGNFISVSMEK